MRPSLIAASKASRFPLLSKNGNKDYYKGSRQANPPGIGFRTGAPGKHVVRGTGNFRIIDELVRIFVGPGFLEEGKSTFVKSELRPFVHCATPTDEGFVRSTASARWYDEASDFMGNEGPEHVEVQAAREIRRAGEARALEEEEAGLIREREERAARRALRKAVSA